MSLISLFKDLQEGFTKDLLVILGITFGTSAITLNALNIAVSKLRSDVNQMSDNILMLMHLSGIDVAMSIIIGAIVTRHTIRATKFTLQKVGG